MIDDPPILEVRRTIVRPTQSILDGFVEAPTGNVADALGGSGALTHTIKPVDEAASAFCGVAIPCRVSPADNLAVFAALDIAEPGDVILVATDGYLEAAVTGDLMIGMARNKGVQALVTDGSVRDVHGIRQVGLPCFAAGVSPNSPARNGPGSAGLPIVIGGVAVAAGDIVVGDADGVVVVPADRAEAASHALSAIKSAEADLDAKVQAGLTQLDPVRAILDGPGVISRD
ncbi:MAG: RraA family protein [Pseudomonadota bacterium]